MNKIYKVIWSKVRNCYVAVSEIAKRNGKSCTCVNCGAKASKGRAGVALAVALSLSMAGGGVAWGANRVIDDQNPPTVTSDETGYYFHELKYPSGSGVGTGVNFTVDNGGKINGVFSQTSGNTIIINSGAEVTHTAAGQHSEWDIRPCPMGVAGGVNNNRVEIAGTVNGAVVGGYSNGNTVTNNTVTGTIALSDQRVNTLRVYIEWYDGANENMDNEDDTDTTMALESIAKIDVSASFVQVH